MSKQHIRAEKENKEREHILLKGLRTLHALQPTGERKRPAFTKLGCSVAHEADIYNNISAQTQEGIIERMLL